MNNISIPIIIGYILVVSLISFFSFNGKFDNLFGSQKTVSWWITGLSYFIISSENVNMLSKMGIVIDEGYSGLWIFYCSVLSVGFIPVIFAPLWSRLKFITDNQFILMRFSGFGAKVLHIFRAAYVGYLATSIFISLYLIALIKLLVLYLSLSYTESFIIVSIIAFLVILKNSYNVKVQTDIFNSILYLVAFIVGSLLVVSHFGGFKEIYFDLNSNHSESLNLFSDTTNSNTGINFFVYFAIQWWSISIIDGSGPKAQRFMSVRTPLDAFKTAIFPILLMSIMFVFKSFVLDTGLYVSHISPELVPRIGGVKDYEGFFISLFSDSLSPIVNTLVFIAFFIGLTSIFEALLNWGASFISVDLYSTYINKEASEKSKIRTSYLAMILIVSTGLAIAYFNTYLLGVQKFIFSMAAGVGPVFVLRWFWKRINAWSQLSAMLSSLLLTIGFDYFFNNIGSFNTLISSVMRDCAVSYYPLKLTVLTVLVSIIWITVTFVTRPDDKKHLEAFYKRLSTAIKPTRHSVLWKSIFLIILPMISILPFLFVWSFKFYSTLLGSVLLVMWICLILVVVLRMNKIYPSSQEVGLNGDC